MMENPYLAEDSLASRNCVCSTAGLPEDESVEALSWKLASSKPASTSQAAETKHLSAIECIEVAMSHSGA
jgi:hypothetical protein